MISPFFLLLFLFLLYMSVLYKSSSSLALCLLFLFWAAASVFQLLYSRKKVQVDFPFSAHTGAKESQAVFTFTIKNQGVEEELNFALYCLLHGAFYPDSKELFSLYSREYPTDTWASRLLLDTSLTLWQEDRKLVSSSQDKWKEDMALTEITL